jgi:hypothetical protein
MSTLAIFSLGLIVTGITLAAVFLIGLDEAGDPAQSKLSDLSSLEKSLVDRSGAVESETAVETP